ncbi:MAG: chemotaxis protein CheA [Cellulomonas sp.]|nr:chemotaxis protein CheA [Cellulomonas sp.]
MGLDEDMAGVLATFVTEAVELVEDMEQGLLLLESDPASVETIHAVFRAVHTLKGSSGMFGLDHLGGFAHVVESVLDRVRAGELDVTPELVSALLPCSDHLAAVVAGVQAGRLEATAAEVADGQVLLTHLEPFLAEVPGTGTAPVRSAGDNDPTVAAGDPVATDPVPVRWDVSVRFGPDCLRNGMDLLAFLHYLATLGSLAQVRLDTSVLPEVDEMDPESCYLGVDLVLETCADKDSIDAVFDFVREDSTIAIRAGRGQLDDLAERARAATATGHDLGDALVLSGALTARELAAARLDLGTSAPGADGESALGDLLVSRGLVLPEVVHGCLRRVGPAEPVVATAPVVGAHDGQSIRVDAVRLDKLIDLVGELVIAQASAGLRATAVGDVHLLEAHSEVMRLVEGVRESALSLRMVPIGTTFRRFERVVRDVGADLGKDVRLVLSGGDAEVDKALVDRIGDPLMHLVRNSLDHAFEDPAERGRTDKPSCGTLRLHAFHDSGNVVIEVIDDGRGLDRERLIAKAVERGLVEPDAVLTDQEAYGLIFEPGFSTAESVSNLSGRGVGMDVVRRNVAALRGTVEIESVLGRGTTVRIRLPLTLAIIDGFLVGVGDSAFVLPLERVTECVELRTGASPRQCMELRGAVLPLIRLRDLFAIPGQAPGRQNVVVVEHAGQRAGLVVDVLLGEFQTVIKPLGLLFSHLQGISGSTILGNGDAALILDVGALVTRHAEQERSRQLGAA